MNLAFPSEVLNAERTRCCAARAESDRKKCEEHCHSTQHDVEGIAECAATGSEDFTLMHLGKRP